MTPERGIPRVVATGNSKDAQPSMLYTNLR